MLGEARKVASHVLKIWSYFGQCVLPFVKASSVLQEASGLKNEVRSPLSDKGSPSSGTSQMGAQAMEKGTCFIKGALSFVWCSLLWSWML